MTIADLLIVPCVLTALFLSAVSLTLPLSLLRMPMNSSMSSRQP